MEMHMSEARCVTRRSQPRRVDVRAWWPEISYFYGSVPVIVLDAAPARLRTPDEERREMAAWIDRQHEGG